MPRYKYTAKSIKGEKKSGILEAESKHELARILRKQGYVLVSANFKAKISLKDKLAVSLPFFNAVSLVEKLMFTRNLRVMVSAGISLPRALRVLANQAKSKKFRNVLLKVEKEIVKGNSFSDALSKYPAVFPELFYSMVKVGEESGTLEQVLEVLTQQMEREYELKSKIKGAMVYPAVIVTAMVGIGVLMLILVVPKLAQTFADLEIELPLTTQLVIGAGSFLAKFWYVLLIIILLSVILSKIALKTKTGKLIRDSLVLKIPVIASIIKKTNSAYTVRTLSSLISAGVPIVRSLEIVSGTLGNIYYKRAILEAANQVRKGAKLADVLKGYKDIYPILIIQMIEIGEETGETSTILKKLAEFFEEEVARATKNLSALIEPVLMLIVGAAVGFFAISMIQPMYSMLGAL